LARYPEKWKPVFGKDHAQNKELEREGDAKKSHPALMKQPADIQVADAGCGHVPAQESCPLKRSRHFSSRWMENDSEEVLWRANATCFATSLEAKAVTMRTSRPSGLIGRRSRKLQATSTMPASLISCAR